VAYPPDAGSAPQPAPPSMKALAAGRTKRKSSGVSQRTYEVGGTLKGGPRPWLMRFICTS
jgi:hypothetical protein